MLLLSMLHLWPFYRSRHLHQNSNSNSTLSFLCLRIFVLNFTPSYGGLASRPRYWDPQLRQRRFQIAQQHYYPFFVLNVVVCIRSLQCHVCADWEVWQSANGSDSHSFPSRSCASGSPEPWDNIYPSCFRHELGKLLIEGFLDLAGHCRPVLALITQPPVKARGWKVYTSYQG